MSKLPLILLASVALIFFFDGYIPYDIKAAIYAVSLSVKSLIIFSLPFIIFMLLFKTVAQLSRDATKVILFILAGIILSNFLSTMISYVIGSQLYHLDLSIAQPQEASGLAPSAYVSLPKLIANDVAMFGGLALGLLLSFVQPTLASSLSLIFDRLIKAAFKVLTYIVPVFIAGFLLKLSHDKVIDTIAKDYALIFSIVGLSLAVYISCLYFVSSRLQPKAFVQSVKNMFPAAMAGFSSMSSAAAMPLTIIGAEKNSLNPNLARIAIPTTVNIHLIGDCFAIPIFAFAVMKNFGMAEASFIAYLVFALYFVLAKFSVAAIPGGGIIVMLPILESQLGFTPEMASLITALYILFDPVITCANVMGNGAFSMLFDRLYALFAPKSARANVHKI